MTTIKLYKETFEIGANEFTADDAENLACTMCLYDDDRQPEQLAEFTDYLDGMPELAKLQNYAEYIKAGVAYYRITVYWLQGEDWEDYADDMPHVLDGYVYKWTESPYWYAVQELDEDGAPLDNGWDFGSLDEDEAREMGESYEHYQVVTIDLTGDNGNGVAVGEENIK